MRTQSERLAPTIRARQLAAGSQRPAQNELGAGQELFVSVVTSNWIEKLCGSVVE